MFRKSIAIFAISLTLVAGARPAAAHDFEPISTEYARPFIPGSGSLHIVYELERERGGERLFAIPEAELELGLTRRLQINAGYALLGFRETPGGPTTFSGGRFEVGARYLLFGSAEQPYAVSLQAEIEAPTGSSDIVGDATELGAAVHVDRRFGRVLRLHSNLGWSTTVGGSEETERVFRYSNALVWRAAPRWSPVVEVLGETDTRTGETHLAIQPEVLFWGNSNVEIKVGVPIGLNSNTPAWGFRAKVTFLWGTE